MKTVKQFLKNAVRHFLEILVKIRLKRTRPTIIGITGSFGKTSTKEAIYEILRTKWRVYRNEKSLNTEIGLLLAVLEQPSGFTSPVKWIFILLRAIINAFRGGQYDYLILEYGADKPKDIKHLVSMVKPHIGIITNIADVHQNKDQFKDAAHVFEEKKKLVECLSDSDIAILNKTDKLIRSLDGKLRAKTFWFNGPDINASNLANTAAGFSTTICAPGYRIKTEFKIPGIYHVNIILPALLCGVLTGIPLIEGIKALKNFRLPPGRMSVIEGKNGSILLDGSYNASPETMKQALELLHDFPAKRRFAVLGNMNELGDKTFHSHAEIGHKIGLWLDGLITVGDNAKIIAEEALKRGFPASKIKSLSSSIEAGHFISKHQLDKGDIILFKGSQNNVRLERAIKMLMKSPEDAKKLLCRQEPEWEKIN